MFATYTGGSEAVFVTLYNNVSPIASQNINRYNLWEQGIRPGNINGGGGKTPTAEIIDIFPMVMVRNRWNQEFIMTLKSSF